MDWRQQLYWYCENSRPHDGVYIILEQFDNMFCDGKFAQADDMLSGIDLERLDSYALVALATTTLHAREHLPSRPAMMEKLEARLFQLVPERAENLIKNRR